MDIDYNSQTGFILIFLILLGYIVGVYFNIGYLGKAYKSKGGDFERFLGLFSIGMTTFILILGVFILLFYKFVPTLAASYLPQMNINLVPLSMVIFIVLFYLFLGAVALSLLCGVFFRFVKNKYSQKDITIVTIDPVDIVVSEIYDENADYFFFIDKNENWGMIRKSLVNKIISKRKESTIKEKK
ncbi:hypothetical protein METP2_00492 [Methanosarcinales archaeon]|nr:hypothetical protein [Candidatus Methanoperedens sp.]CAG0955855.1 hypothetical protein METP2_00492 [Methanosarcinales archaeon]